jgi:hypothetical protein
MHETVWLKHISYKFSLKWVNVIIDRLKLLLVQVVMLLWAVHNCQKGAVLNFDLCDLQK